MLADRFLPLSDSLVFRHILVDASPERAYAGLRQFDFFRVPAVRLPNLIRMWPERLWQRMRGRGPLSPTPKSVTLDDLIAMGSFQVLAEEPGRELVLGSIGRFWTRDFGPAHVSAGAFTSFVEPGYGKIAWSIRVEPFGQRRSLITVDIRTGTTDDAARAHFKRYWLWAGLAVSYMTRRALIQVKKDLERARPSEAGRGPELLLEHQLPSFDFQDVFAKEVRADSDTTYTSVSRVDTLMEKDLLMRVLSAPRVALAALGRWLGLRKHSKRGAGKMRLPVTLLAERPGEECVVGVIGQVWQADIPFVQIEAGDFAAFDRPGFARLAIGYVVRPWGTGRSLLLVEVRTGTTDEAARQRFRRYWRILKPGAGLVMRRQLSLIKADAERQARKLPEFLPAAGQEPAWVH